MSDEERQEIINKGEYAPSYMWNVNGWLCSKLGLTIISQTQKCVPQTYKDDIYSSTLDMTIKAGDFRRLEQRKTFKKVIEYIKENDIKYFRRNKKRNKNKSNYR